MFIQFRYMVKTQTEYDNETRLTYFIEWLEFDVKHTLGQCWLCDTFDIVQHQNTCLNCMIDYSKVIEESKKKWVNHCCMCGQKRKLIENTCNSCLNSAC